MHAHVLVRVRPLQLLGSAAFHCSFEAPLSSHCPFQPKARNTASSRPGSVQDDAACIPFTHDHSAIFYNVAIHFKPWWQIFKKFLHQEKKICGAYEPAKAVVVQPKLQKKPVLHPSAEGVTRSQHLGHITIGVAVLHSPKTYTATALLCVTPPPPRHVPPPPKNADSWVPLGEQSLWRWWWGGGSSITINRGAGLT